MANGTEIPSAERVVPGSANITPAPWPATARTPAESIDAPAVAEQIIASLNKAFANQDADAVAALFLPDPPSTSSSDQNEEADAAATGFWRDHLILSWRLRTAKAPSNIKALLSSEGEWAAGLDGLRLEVDSSSVFRAPKVVSLRPKSQVTGVDFFVRVENKVGVGRGVVRLAETEAGWRVWTLFTTLEGVKGHEERTGARREVSVQYGGVEGRRNWRERREAEREFVGREPEVLIIGAGQGGLTAAARLKMLGISALVIDRNKAVGDNWRKRYHQLVLHDPVWYDHLPYFRFPESWPVFTPKDKLADWLESYVKALDLDVWTQTEVVSSIWDEVKKEWTAVIKRTRADGTTEERTFHPKHLILATGHSSKKYMPTVPGLHSFQGNLLCHSSDFPGARENGHGKKAVVVGACNSSMDICQDYIEKGYDVTMVQRSTTYVISSESVLKISLGGLYEEGGPPVEDSDIVVWGWPSHVLKSINVEATEFAEQRDKETLDGLEKAGFKTDRGPHGGGLMIKYLTRGGGYYIDVGGAQPIIDGKVQVKHGQEVTEVLPKGLKLADGTELKADEIVFATGFENMKETARAIIGDEATDKVDDIWGWAADGEMRTIWTESGHSGLWFHGGNLAMCRYYSQLIALQILAKLKGLGTGA